MHRGNRREPSTILQAVHIDDGTHATTRLGDSGDEDAAATANKEITGAGSEPISLNQRPIIFVSNMWRWVAPLRKTSMFGLLGSRCLSMYLLEQASDQPAFEWGRYVAAD